MFSSIPVMIGIKTQSTLGDVMIVTPISNFKN